MKWTKLGDIIPITSGGTPLTSRREYYDNGTIPWVKTGDLKSQYIIDAPDMITPLGLENSSAKIFPVNTVLIAMYGATIGNCSILKIEAATNQACAALLPSEHVNEEYLYFYLRTIKQKLIAQGVGGGQPNISGAILKHTNFPLIPLENQIHIASILSKAESLINQRKEGLRLLDEFLKSTFFEMFGDLARNERKWESKYLGKICDVGSSKRVFVEELVSAGIPFYRGTEIGQLAEGAEPEPSLFITKSHYDQLRTLTGIPKIGDLLLPSICPDGRIFRVVNNQPFYFKDGRVLWIKVNEQVINSIFLQYALKSIFKSNYKNIASGTTFAELKIVSLKQITLPTPPSALQLKFSRIVQKIEILKCQFESSLEELENLYASLSQRAFKGELTLK